MRDAGWIVVGVIIVLVVALVSQLLHDNRHTCSSCGSVSWFSISCSTCGLPLH